MDFVCDICSFIGNSFIFDKIWWKDYGIPLIGTIGVPLVVWFLTRYYGADKAEERKEEKELRDNLNLLSSILLSTFKSLLLLKKNFENFQKVYPLNVSPYDKMNKIDKCLFVDFPILNTIEIAKYSPCIKAYGNFVIDLTDIKQGCYILNELIEHRNEILKSIASCEDKHAKGLRIFDFVAEDSEGNLSNLMRTNKLILEIKEIIDKINTLETKIKNLKLEKVTFDKNSLQQVEKIKKEIKKFEHKPKEQENDK